MTDFVAKKLLDDAGLRTTRQRRAIANLLFADQKNRHVTAEWVAGELKARGTEFALGTVYNTLHSFVEAGLLREVNGVEQGIIVFDTNATSHHHFYDEVNKKLIDIPVGYISIAELPEAPEGKSITGLDVIIRVK